MKTKGIFHQARKWWHALGHFRHLGRTATNRSFLLRERKKLLFRLGEKTLPWLREQKSPPPDFERLLEQIGKIDQVLARLDYGGENGTDFAGTGHQAKKKRRGS